MTQRFGCLLGLGLGISRWRYLFTHSQDVRWYIEFQLEYMVQLLTSHFSQLSAV
jgi:hypothetical protein